MKRRPHSYKLGMFLGVITIFSLLQFFHSSHIINHTDTVQSPHSLEQHANRPLHGGVDNSITKSSFSKPTANRPKRKDARWAYAFLVAGCDPAKPWNYRNYIYNILISKYVLEMHESKADVVVMLQLSKYTESNETRLHRRDEDWLNKMNVRFLYLPKPYRDNFYSAQMEKFRVLQLTEYSRVLYMDADAMPLCNLDYLFEASSPIDTNTDEHAAAKDAIGSNQQRPLLQPNAIFAWFNEPAHGGIFMLGPEPGDYGAVQRIIERREQEALELPYPHWNPSVGWGKQIPDSDHWKVIQSKNGSWTGLPGYPPSEIYDGKDWTFHGDFADQGLLFYWTKYYKKQVSIINLDEIETWSSDKNNQPHLQATTLIQPSLLQQRTCLPKMMEYPNHFGSTRHQMFYGHAPHRDFIHFSGDSKPWESPAPNPLPEKLEDLDSSKAYWYWCLRQVTRKLNVTIRNFDKLPHSRKPALGRYPTHKSMKNTIETKRKHMNQTIHDAE